MAWRGPHPIFLLVLLAACLALAMGKPSFEKFENNHVRPPRTRIQRDKDFCNWLMKARGITLRNCESTHSFIHADVNDIIDVCGREGTPAGEKLQDSLAYFPLTNCRLQGTSRGPTCNYNGETTYRPIRIACEEGKPVHLEKII